MTIASLEKEEGDINGPGNYLTEVTALHNLRMLSSKQVCLLSTLFQPSDFVAKRIKHILSIVLCSARLHV